MGTTHRPTLMFIYQREKYTNNNTGSIKIFKLSDNQTVLYTTEYKRKPLMIGKYYPFILQISKNGSGRLSNLSKVTQKVKLVIKCHYFIISKFTFTLKETIFTISNVIQKNRS